MNWKDNGSECPDRGCVKSWKELSPEHELPRQKSVYLPPQSMRLVANSNITPNLRHYVTCNVFLFCFWRNSPQWARTSSFTRFLDHTRRTTVGRTPLDEWSARRRDLYLTSHNTRNRYPSMPPVGFEPAISVSERPHSKVFVFPNSINI